MHEGIRKAAAHQLMVDIHDEFRDTGYRRTYPNLMTVEGIFGNEEFPTPTHNAALPFTRFLTGPGDYTYCWYSGKLKVTHAHQLALSTIYFSPWQVLFWYDRPGQFGDDPALDYWKNLPTCWDETRVLKDQIGQCASVARRRGSEWFIGTINPAGGEIQIPLSFLEAGAKYTATIYGDRDVNDPASKAVKIETIPVDRATVLKPVMSTNGGQAVRIVRATQEDRSSTGTSTALATAAGTASASAEAGAPIGIRKAPAPLFRDPVHDGAADATLVWNRAEQCWWMLYTNRRADADDEKGVKWVHGTDIGIASTPDGGATWNYRGIARGLEFETNGTRNTFWAPEVVDFGGKYHAFISYVRGVPETWKGTRDILHYTSTNLLDWKFESIVVPGSIDACVHRLPDGRWRMWFKNEQKKIRGTVLDSEDLYTWKPTHLRNAGSRPRQGRRPGRVLLEGLVLDGEGPVARAGRVSLAGPRRLEVHGRDPRQARQASRRPADRPASRRARAGQRPCLPRLLRAPGGKGAGLSPHLAAGRQARLRWQHPDLRPRRGI